MTNQNNNFYFYFFEEKNNWTYKRVTKALSNWTEHGKDNEASNSCTFSFSSFFQLKKSNKISYGQGIKPEKATRIKWFGGCWTKIEHLSKITRHLSLQRHTCQPPCLDLQRGTRRKATRWWTAFGNNLTPSITACTTVTSSMINCTLSRCKRAIHCRIPVCTSLNFMKGQAHCLSHKMSAKVCLNTVDEGYMTKLEIWCRTGLQPLMCAIEHFDVTNDSSLKWATLTRHLKLSHRQLHKQKNIKELS